MVSRAIRLCGTDDVDPPMRRLRAGPLSADFDNGALRYIDFGGVEVLRGIAFLLRDENWGTFTPVLSDLHVEEREDRFEVRYRGRCEDAVRALVYDARITGDADGTLAFEVTAEPLTDVLTNRTGFIVLHPVEGVAGAPVKVLHVDGRVEEARFPRTIQPACPFKDIRALTHEIAPGVHATCTMEGDTFEMEDQRNWSDASYKTYVRPLTRPWPYTLPKGETVTQAVRLSIAGGHPVGDADRTGPSITVEVGGEAGTMPAVGIGVPAGEASHALERIDLVRRLAPRSLVCEVDLRRNHGRAEMERYRALQAATGAELVLEIITLGSLDPTAELAAVARSCADGGLEPDAVSVFPQQDMASRQPGAAWPEMPSFEETYAAARKAFPRARLGGGMAAYFTELNRKRPPPGSLDFVTHTTCPIVHAADDRSVMETNEAIGYQILSTRDFMGDDLAYRIGPSQIGCRENPYGKATTPNPDNRRVCLSDVDPRQRGVFNAAWTLAYVAACARGGIDAVSVGAPTGPFGHIARRTEFAQPYFDDRDDALVYPSFHVVAGLAGLAGAVLLDVAVQPRGRIEAIAAHADGREVVWIANVTPEPVTIDLPAIVGNAGARIVVIDADEFVRLTTEPDYLDTAGRDLGPGLLTLDGYAVARIEAP